MQIETYLQENCSTEAAILAEDSEHQDLVESLGLNGQKRLREAASDNIIPFPIMTAEKYQVYTLCFPERCSPKDFIVETIPTRVLKLLKFVQDQNLFTNLVIHATSSATVVDPVLIGTLDIKHPTHNYTERTNYYLLARWGNSLLPFTELVKHARAIGITKRKAAINKIKGLIALAEAQDMETVPLSVFVNEPVAYHLD